MVAAVAAYASYVHQRSFALPGGADATSAALWPLSVDGLLLLATVGLLKPDRHADRRACAVVWMVFLLGIGMSLAANIAAAPALAWKPVLVAGWTRVALLFSVELLADRSGNRELAESTPRDSTAHGIEAQWTRTESRGEQPAERQRDTFGEGENMGSGSRTSTSAQPKAESSAEQIMWKHFQQQRTVSRTPTGAELNRVAGTNNYGRAVLARWRRAGRIPAGPAEASTNGAVTLSKGGSGS
jgi:uncharacterized membrane protein